MVDSCDKGSMQRRTKGSGSRQDYTDQSTKNPESKGSPESNFWPCTGQPQKIHYLPENIVQKLTELLQAWCHHHFPGEPIPAFNSPLGEEPLPKIRHKLPADTASGHSIGSCHQTGEISAWSSFSPYKEHVTSWTHIQLAIDQDHQILFHSAALQSLIPQSICTSKVVLSQVDTSPFPPKMDHISYNHMMLPNIMEWNGEAHK
ncbi:hypothetical protein DUI87_09082 [Hirundo rustica rustica]|uniref:Uncharacterized protein n=1 Tax=Hirundo rustica rustica TaxID=333673 RepID=A0A3M0KL72_HIRRU|nr:hypothetical protein DUI87_09082 [Hirundo rustica rustica]